MPHPESPRDPSRRAAALLLGALGAGTLAACADPKRREAIGSASSPATTGESVLTVDTVLGAHPATGTRPGVLAQLTARTLGTSIAVAKGCVEPGDGGGGVFVWVPYVDADDDDGGTIIVPDAAACGDGGGELDCGAWVRVPNGPAIAAPGAPLQPAFHGALHVGWFGAAGDGDTADDLPLQAACDAAGKLGAWVELGPRTYKLSAPIEVPAGVGIGGAGERTMLVADLGEPMAEPTRSALRFASPAAYGRGGFLRRAWVYAVTPCKALVEIEGRAALELSDCRLDGGIEGAGSAAHYGVFVRYVMDVTLEAVRVGRCLRAGLFVETPVGGDRRPLDTTTLRCRDCSFRTTEVGPGAEVEGLAIHFEDCIFESNGTGKAEPGRGLVIRRGSTNVIGCHFENNGGDDVFAGTEESKSGEIKSDRATYLSFVNGVFRGGFERVPPRAAGACGIRCRSVLGGVIVGTDFTQVDRPIVFETRNPGLAEGVLVAGCRFGPQGPRVVEWAPDGSGVIVEVEQPIATFPGLIQTTDHEGRCLLSGEFRMRVGGGSILRGHWAFQVSLPEPLDLPPLGVRSWDVAIPVEVGVSPEALTRATFSLGYLSSNGALPVGVLASASFQPSPEPAVRITAFNASDGTWYLTGGFRVGIWEHGA